MNVTCVDRMINFKNELCVGLRQGGGNKKAQAKKEKHYHSCHPWDICGLSIEQHK